MHRGNFFVSLDSPAPDNPPGSGGLVVSLTSADTTKLTVPAQVIVPTGATSANFTVTGLASTKDAAGVDHPVTLTASEGTGHDKRSGERGNAGSRLSAPPSTRSTFSPVQGLIGTVLNPVCQGCGEVLNNALTLTFAAIDPSTSQASGIVTISPTQVTIPINGASTNGIQVISIGTPTGVGQYVVTLSAPGLTTVTSGTVTVTQPSITSIAGNFGNSVAAGMQRSNFFVGIDSPAPSQGVVINLASSDSSGDGATVR